MAHSTTSCLSAIDPRYRCKSDLLGKRRRNFLFGPGRSGPIVRPGGWICGCPGTGCQSASSSELCLRCSQHRIKAA